MAREPVAQGGADGALRLGVAGVGHFGRYHAEKMAAIDGARLVAVADIDSAPGPRASRNRSTPIPCPTTAP